MALNETTGIDYEVDRFVYIFVPNDAAFDINDPSTYEVRNWFAQWGRQDGAAINGLNPALRYYKRLPEFREDSDHRYTLNLNRTYVLTDPAPGPGLPVGTYQERFLAAKRSIEELKIQVANEFKRQVQLLVPQASDETTVVMAGDALARYAAGLTLTPAQQARLDALPAIGDAVEQLIAYRDQYLAAIDADQDYDLSFWGQSLE
jgi:hypothetical protein